MKTILCLASNPRDTVRLQIEREFLEIRRSLEQQCVLKCELKATIESARTAIAENNPHAIHFSAHGTKDGGIVLEDHNGVADLVSGKQLMKLFATCTNLEVVVLNACYSAAQAREMVELAPYVVGMSDAVYDLDAVAFAAKLYNALGHNVSIDDAYSLARTVHLLSSSREFVPILVKRGLDDAAYELD